jgi:hypothetical protein
MNERIKELAREAGPTTIGEINTNIGNVHVINIERFAELIVRECCQTVERRYKYSNGTPVSFWEMSQDVQDLLKAHFGVEE